MNFRNLLSGGSCLFLIACSSMMMVPGEGIEADIDFSSIKMRHGWNVFTGPKATQLTKMDVDAVQRGKKIFEKNCLACHGATGRGDGPMARKLKIRPANLRKLAPTTPNSYLVMQIQRGKGNMPKWEDILTPEQSADISHYLLSIQDK